MRCSWCQQIIIRNLSMFEIVFPWQLSLSELCPTCFSRLNCLTKQNSCPRCMKPKLPDTCQDCLRWQQEYPQYQFSHQALFQYNEGMKEWLAAFKYHGDYRLAQTFHKEIRQALKKYRDCLLVPLPLTSERLAIRGFNQVEALLKAANLNYQSLLKRTDQQMPQAKKKRRERLAMEQPFALGADVSLSGKKIILVDDVYTTGRTLFYAAEIIQQNQGEVVLTFSLAR
ncbi:MAG: ComF family protein [Enterococcus sp.]